MSVQHAGLTIQEARLKAGLTQEQLSEGICSPVSLSRIESGSAGVSPITFQALMSKAGAPCEAFPVFASRADFDCFYTLKRAKFYIDIWNLSKGYHELDKVETANFADNKFYYQEWLLLHSRLQFRSGCGNHQHIFETLSAAITISKPEIDFFDFRNLLFSTTEIELLIALAQEALYLSKLPMCLEICTQISSYLENSAFSFLERDNLLAANAIVYAKYLIAVKDYSMALEVADKYRKIAVQNADDTYLHELSFLSGLAEHFLSNIQNASILFRTAFFSAHSIDSVYSSTIYNYLVNNLNVTISDTQKEITLPAINSFMEKEPQKSINLSNGVYNSNFPNVLTLGKLIKDLRKEQKISQQILCQGLCSKSTLSKIENNTLEPSIALAESLLQRLGICDTFFRFYGSAHDSELKLLRNQLALVRLTEPSKILNLSNKLLSLATAQDHQYIQYTRYKQALLMPDRQDQADALFEIINCLLPNFSFEKINSYRLSWLEITVLNNYCAAICYTSPAIGIQYFQSLAKYYTQANMDVLEQRRFMAITHGILSQFLYSNKYSQELIDCFSIYMKQSKSYSLYFSALMYSHLSQALAETNNTIKHTAHYAYYNLLITNRTADAEKVLNIFSKQYSLDLNTF